MLELSEVNMYLHCILMAPSASMGRGAYGATYLKNVGRVDGL